MRKILLFAFFLGFAQFLLAQSNQEEIKVEWLSLEQVKDTFLQRQKPIFLFISDEKNDSSQLMVDSVLSDRDIANYLNVYFYCVKIDISSQEDLTFFNDSIYKFNPNSAIHPLVQFLTNGNNRFPALVMFRKNGSGELYNGYYNKTHLFPILIYYAEEAYRTVTYDEYLEFFRLVYPEESTTGYSMVRSVTKWHTLEEALELQKENPKKILIDFYLNERNLSTIQYMQTYNNNYIGNLVNEYFYAVRLNGTSKDTINVFGASYLNPGTPHPFHQLVVAMLNGQMYFPSLMILDENAKMLDRIQAYLRPADIEPILNFYGKDKHKVEKFDDYKKSFKSQLPEPQK